MKINTFGGRRFLMTIGCGVVTSFLAWFAKIDGNAYALTIGGTVGAYILGNTAQKIKGEPDADV